MRRVIASLLLGAFAFLGSGLPALSADRVVIYSGQLGLSTEQNQGPRFQRLAFGTWIYNALGPSASAGGVYSNLSVIPNGGMYVATTPTVPSTLGSLYQIAVDDANPIPATGTNQLAADSTKIVIQGLQGSSSASLGPLSAPTSGLSQYYLVEGQVQTVDTTPTSLTFTSANGSYTNTVNITRADQIVYQLKAGTASSSPTVPTVDTGWIGIATVLVPSGTSTITTGMISPLQSFTGFLTNGQAATISALILQGYSTGCLQVVAGGAVQSLPCTSGLGVVNGTSGQINVSTVAGTATISLAHGDYADLLNAQTIGGAKTFSAAITADSNVDIPAAGTATSGTNYGSAGAFSLFNSLWVSGAPQSNSWAIAADNAGNLTWQYDSATKGSLSSAGTASFSNLILSALSASSCVGSNGSEQLVSSSYCLSSITAGSCLTSTGGSTPTLSLQTPLPESCGGSGATSYTSGALIYNNAGVFASAAVSSPLGFSGGSLGCATCVTAVTGTGNIASTGGTTPQMSFTGLLSILNGGCNAASYTSGDILYYNGTKCASSPLDYNVTNSGAFTSSVSFYVAQLVDSGSTASTLAWFNSSQQLASVSVTAPLLFSAGTLSPQTSSTTSNNFALTQPSAAPSLQPGAVAVQGPVITATASPSPVPAPCMTPGNGGYICANDSAGGGAHVYLGSPSNYALIDFNHTNASALTSSVKLYLPGLNNSALTPSSLMCADASSNESTSCSGLSPSLTGVTLSGATASTLAYFNGSKGLASVTISATSPISLALSSGTLSASCGTCAVTNANNNFSASQAITGYAAATSYVGAGSATMPSPTPGDLYGSESATTGRACVGGYTSRACLDWNITNAGEATISQALSAPNYYDTGVTANSPLYNNGSQELAAAAVTSPLLFSGGTFSLQTGSTGSANVALLQPSGTPTAQPGALDAQGPLITATASPSPVPAPCMTPGNGGYFCANDSSGGGAHIYLGSPANYALIDFNHTDSNALAISVGVYVPNLYDANLSSGSVVGASTNGQLVNETLGNGLGSSGNTLSVNGCGSSTCKTGLEFVLGAVSGAATTSALFFPIRVGDFSGGVLTTLATDCGTAASGVVFTLYHNGSSAATITTGSSAVTTTTISVSLSSGDTLLGAVTTGGSAANCSLEVDGTQNDQ